MKFSLFLPPLLHLLNDFSIKKLSLFKPMRVINLLPLINYEKFMRKSLVLMSSYPSIIWASREKISKHCRNWVFLISPSLTSPFLLGPCIRDYHLINLLPTLTLQNKSPYFMFYKKSPTIHSLRFLVVNVGPTSAPTTLTN